MLNIYFDLNKILCIFKSKFDVFVLFILVLSKDCSSSLWFFTKCLLTIKGCSELYLCVCRKREVI